MDTFKVENYEREHGNGSFPAYKRLDAQELQEVRERFASALGIDGTSSGSEIGQTVQDISQPIEGANAEAEGFDLRNLLDQLGLTIAEKIYINWYQYDDIDLMRATDMISCFTDIWYPSSDDIDVFDLSMSWILSISHYGAVRIARMKNV